MTNLTTMLAQQRPEFLDAPAYPVLSDPAAIAVGDFDGDGKPDIVETGRGMTTLLGNGDGTFRTGKNSAMSQTPNAIAVGDFNEDGKLDVVTSDFLNNVSVSLGIGDGSFQQFTNYPAGRKPNSVAVADFNGDKHLDLAVGDGDDLEVLLGKGDGSFQAAHSWSAGTNVFRVAVGDFNGDKAVDVVTVDPADNNLNILLGNGNGTFQTAYSLDTGLSPQDVLATDLNGDSILDLVVSNSSNFTIGVFRGNGDGTFKMRQDFPTIEQPIGLISGDFNGDHETDIVTLSFDAELFTGNGDGTLQYRGDFGAASYSRDFAFGRFNQDSLDDVAVLNLSSVSILLGNPNGMFRTRRLYNLGPFISAETLLMADANNDGQPDALSVLGGNDGGILVLLGNHDGSFRTPLTSLTGKHPWRFAIGDFNNDGKIDAATSNMNDFVSSTLSVVLGNGDGTFQAAQTYAIGNFPGHLAVGDFNNDGFQDIANISFDNNGGITWLNLLLNNGDGTFQNPVRSRVDGTVDISSIDINGDGKPDLLLTAAGLDVLLGNGDGTFQPPLRFGTGFGPVALTIADLNRDGKLDVVTGNLGGNVSVLLGNGDGTFKPHTDYAIVNQANAVGVGDFNGDGRLDLAVAETQPDTEGEFVRVLWGNGDGTLQSGVDYEAGALPFGIGVGDFNHDGANDIATMSIVSLSVLLNGGATKLTLTSSENPSHAGDSVTFTATVKATMPGMGNPRGRVRFEDGKTILGTVALNSGTAQFTTSTLGVGNHRIDAVYEGDSHFNRHKSDVLVQQVLP